MEFIDLFPILRELNIWSLLVRIGIAVLCGAVIGVGRGRQHHAAGLRTHILVCIGACSTMLLSQYLSEYYGSGDIARLGAQVISGIGFLGAGTIMVTGRNQVKGLTTAAGLWASACMGLAAGAGFYECALIMCVVLYVVLVLLGRLDDNYIKSSHVLSIAVEIERDTQFGALIRFFKGHGWRLSNFEQIGRTDMTSAFKIDVSVGKDDTDRNKVLDEIRELDGVLFAEEL